MNHIYKVIFNKATGTFVAVAEYAKGQGKKSNGVVGAKSSTKTSTSLATRTFVLSSLTAALIGLSGTAMGAVIDGVEVLPRDRNGRLLNPIPAPPNGDQNLVIATNNQRQSGNQDPDADFEETGVSANEKHAIAIGSQAHISNVKGGSGNIAIGRGAKITGSANKTIRESIAIGPLTKITADQSVGIGNNVVVSGNSSVAIGGDDIDKIVEDEAYQKLIQEYTGLLLGAV